MRFEVTPGQLVSGASSIDAGGPGDGTLPPASMAGAAASTPVDGAWAAFFSAALGAAVALDGVSADLANGMRTAASNYSQTEMRNTQDLGGGR
jgi:Excreted virulence factor EspC, type VII ESX diderm